MNPRPVRLHETRLRDPYDAAKPDSKTRTMQRNPTLRPGALMHHGTLIVGLQMRTRPTADDGELQVRNQERREPQRTRPSRVDPLTPPAGR
ncbi:hypothetical protein FQA47_000212 [Oryzias melastigma]|uniref:Uncharacterized protein n=1 Tax=Oryzias melastigma TaxID=30732 RepID=A0A834CA08_ORYME|nr:hypothetical protein FQA47_000212 [Oryzias melastigma]